jgi:hypothetical protein
LRARAGGPSRKLSSVEWPSFNRSGFDGPGFDGAGFDGPSFDRSGFDGPSFDGTAFRSESILVLLRSFLGFAWSVFGRCGSRGFLLTRS